MHIFSMNSIKNKRFLICFYIIKRIKKDVFDALKPQYKKKYHQITISVLTFSLNA